MVRVENKPTLSFCCFKSFSVASSIAIESRFAIVSSVGSSTTGYDNGWKNKKEIEKHKPDSQ